jgi:hypothetical protein
MGAYNAMQQSDVHAYWEFNYQGTNWVHPLYELPFTGGFPDDLGQPPDTFEDGEIGLLQSIVPGSGPSGIKNMANVVGDNPNLPRETPTSSIATPMMPSGSSGSGVFQAAWPTKSFSMSTRDRHRSNRPA